MKTISLVALVLSGAPAYGDCTGRPSASHPGYREQSGSMLPEEKGKEAPEASSSRCR